MTDAITTTLAKIKAKSPCTSGYKKLCKNLGGMDKYGEDTPLTFRQIHASNGWYGTLWCLVAVEPRWFPLLQHFTVDCAAAVKHLMQDQRSLHALIIARRYADGEDAVEDRAAARIAADTARGAAQGARAVEAARRAAAWATWAGEAAKPAEVAWYASLAAAWAAEDAWGGRAWTAAKTAAQEAQVQRLFEYCRTGKRVFK